MSVEPPVGPPLPRPVKPFVLGAMTGVLAVGLVVVAIVVLRDDSEAATETEVADTIVSTTSTSIEPVPDTTIPTPIVDDPLPGASVGSGTDWAAVPRIPVECPAATKSVSSAGALEAALSSARPGDVIELADGTYQGEFVAATSGTADDPIFLCGSPGAVLDGGGIEGGYALHLDGVDHWRIVGFTVRNGQKGVVADGVTSSVIQGLTVENIGDEGIHLRSASTNNAVVDNTVRRTGMRRDKFGEGIYVGSAESNWSEYGGGGPDRSDNNLVQGNTIRQTTSEAIDIKEGTTGGRVIGNVVDGTGMTAADAPIDIKGNDWLIQGNTVRFAPVEGMQTHRILDGWGSGNRFEGNTVDVVGDGVHFYVHDPRDTGNEIACDNVTGSGGPIRSNVDCVP